MAEADKLCELLFSWLKKRKQLAEKLLALEEELKKKKKRKGTISLAAGSTTSVAVITAVALGTILTGVLSIPLMVGTVCAVSVVSIVSGTSTAKEPKIHKNTMEEAKNIIREDEKIGKDIQKLIEDLKKRCRVQPFLQIYRAYGSTDLGCEVATQIMGALARQNNIDVPLDLLRSFIGSTFYQLETSGRLISAGVVSQSLISAAVTFVSLQVVINNIEISFEESAKGLDKNIGSSGFKLLGVIGFGISRKSFISSCEQTVNSNQGTKARKDLQDVAREIQKASGKLKEHLDAMSEIIKKVSETKDLIKNLRKYSPNRTETGQRIINYVIQSWTDENVVSWLKALPHQTAFINLLYYFEERLQDLPERLKRNRGGHIDIVIVAHGEITDMFMSPALLTPAPNIIDTVLYSPWNCLIDSYAACAIAEGWNNPDGREFCNREQPVEFEPNPLPFHWNHMRSSVYYVPEILLTPVYPQEEVWKHIQYLQGHMDTDGRVIIPYIVPKNCVEAFGEMPFYMFIIALSYILMINEKTATVHLAACLGRGNSTPMPEHWKAQYAYTYDGTCMTTFNRKFRNRRLLQAFRSMFDRNDQE